jgi:SAM-dependent methyltransferase
MPSDHEIARIRSVYRHYRESDAAKARWDGANRGNQAIVRERTRLLARMLRQADLLPLSRRRVLEVGCGVGQALAGLTEWGAVPEHLHGIDLLPDRIEEARRHFPAIHFETANAEELPFASGSFDLVLSFMVFTSILDDGMAHRVAAEVRRVLKPGGALVWYDFRYDNPRSPHVRGMGKASIQSLFSDFGLHLRTVTLLPPLARRLGRVTPLLYPMLASIPPLRTHYMGLLVKP